MTIHNLVATRKITSGSTTISSNPCLLKEIVVSDPGQKCIVAIKDDTTIKMLFTLQQNTEIEGPPCYVIKPNLPIATSLKVEMYKLDPILFLNFNNNSTTLVEDLSGNSQGIDGTMRNVGASIRDEDAERGKFVSFDGTDDYITFGDNFDWNATEEARSFSFWISPSVSGNHYILTKRAGLGIGWDVRRFGTKIELAATRTGQALQAIMTTAITNDVWTHITITVDGSGDVAGVKFYLNGVLDATVSVTDTLAGTSANDASFRISSRQGDKFFFNGKLDEVMIFDRVLSTAEIEFIFRNGYGYGACDGAKLGDITIIHEK